MRVLSYRSHITSYSNNHALNCFYIYQGVILSGTSKLLIKQMHQHKAKKPQVKDYIFHQNSANT